LRKSIFITFEGIESSGKSTQASLLEEKLIKNGYSVALTREPGGPPISEKIRDLILDLNNFMMTPETELLLFMAARNQHTYEFIRPNLETGTIVISDRYIDSTIAYQGAARKLDIELIKQLNSFATYGLIPNLTFILNMPEENTYERVSNKKKDRVELESLDFHYKVREAFLRLARGDKRFLILDGTRSVNELQEIIYTVVEKTIKETL